MPKLHPYQREGVKLMHSPFNGRVLLADEMGLGKSASTLTYMKENNEWPCIIVCPAILKLQWQEEALKWINTKARVLCGKKPFGTKTLKDEKLIVINYEILEKWLPFLYWLKPKVVAGDEIQRIGNLQSKQCKHFRQLCLKTPKVICISGTPFLNKPWELFPTLHLLRPDEFDKAFDFGLAYCDMDKAFGKYTFKGHKNLDQLHRRMKATCMIRRTKEEVLQDLPPLTHTIVPVEIVNRKEYDAAEEDFIQWLAQYDRAAAHRAMCNERNTKINYLRQLAAVLKINKVLEWLTLYMESFEGKLLLGALHRTKAPVIPQLHDWSKAYGGVQIHGDMTAYRRKESELLFRNKPEHRVLVGQIIACGVGLNLPEASTVGVCEIPWNPATLSQFIARAHRLTSTKPVQAFVFVAQDTVEEKLCEINQIKEGIADKVLDGVAVKESSVSIYDQLQEAIRRGR